MKNEAKIKFSAETEEFDSAIKKSNKEISVLRGELKLNEAEMKNNGTSAEGLRKKAELLTKQNEQQKNKTKALSKELEVAKKIYGEDSEEVAKLTNKLNASKASEQRLETQIKQTNSEMKSQKVDAEKLSKAHDTLKGGMDKVANASGVVAGAVAGVATVSVKAFDDVDEGADQVIRKTGATGENAKELENVYKSVAGSIVGDFADIGNAVGEVNTKFHLNGQELKDTTERYLQFANINETDVVTSIDNAYQASQKWNLSNEDTLLLLDHLTKKGQDTGISIDTLFQGINDNSAVLKEMGFDVAQSVEYLAELEVSGISASDGFKAMKMAIKNATEGGNDLNSFLNKNVKDIKSAKTETEALGIAIDTFGAKNAPEMTKAIREGRLTLKGFTKSQKEFGGSVEETFNSTLDGSEDLKLAMQNIKISASEIGAEILNTAQPQIKEFLDVAKDGVEYFKENKEEVVSGIKTVGAVAGTVFAVNKIAKFTNSVKTLGNAVGITYKAIIAKKVESTKATVAETTAQSGLLAVMQAHPVILFGTAIAGLAAGIGYLAMKSKELPEEAKKAREEYTEFNKAIIENGNAVNQQFGVYDRQIENLESIVDKNGKIKKGYEDQAETITGQLSEALGIEISIIDGQIQGYQKLKKKIYETIAAKKAEAVLDANKENYQEAISNQTKYADKIAETSDKIAKESKDVVRANQEVARIEKELSEEQNKRVSDRSQSKINELVNELSVARGIKAANQGQLDNLKMNLKEQQSAYETATRTIENYENLQVAAKTGSTKKINAATNSMINNLKTSTSASKEELKKQYRDTEENLKKMERAYADGRVKKSAVKAARDLRNAAKNELKKANYNSEGKKAADSWVEGMKSRFSNTSFNLAMKIKPSKNVAGKTLTDLNKIVFGANIQANAKGNIVKNPIITAFAEDGPEAAIPINDKPRSKALWLETGRLMGMINTDIGNNSANKSLQIEQTNRLLTAILNKDSNMYVSGYKVSQATATSRDRIDGINNTLAERRIAIG